MSKRSAMLVACALAFGACDKKQEPAPSAPATGTAGGTASSSWLGPSGPAATTTTTGTAAGTPRPGSGQAATAETPPAAVEGFRPATGETGNGI